ncbi:MAG: hypothetical protein PHW54_01535 [Candidatus Omnitrophica bacterium]|nr:hypothetical protein [Candidatus Omnitrophota bacterium]
MAKIFKLFPENRYKEIVREVGIYQYCIYDKDESVPGGIFNKELNIQNYNCVVAGTGSTLSMYSVQIDPVQKIIIPKGEQVIVVRLLRLDDKHGSPHYNADDQIIFPTIDGNIVRLARKDAPDHYIEIAKHTNISNIVDAYKLPEFKFGSVDKYSEKGAKLQVELMPRKDKNKD